MVKRKGGREKDIYIYREREKRERESKEERESETTTTRGMGRVTIISFSLCSPVCHSVRPVKKRRP